MAEIFKDKQLVDAIDDLYRSLSAVRIASIDRDPAAYVRLSERMGQLQTLLIQKLTVRQYGTTKSTDNVRSPSGEIPAIRPGLHTEVP